MGPNGAGKSCVLKAVSFCLALRVEDLNKDNYTYIKNKEAKSNEPVSVEINFRTKLNDNIFVRRTLGPKEKDESYHVNNKTLTKTKYREFIQENKLDVYAGVFIYFQGFSDNLIVKGPNDLRQMFEVVSNSIEFKEECEGLEKELKKFQEDFDKLNEDLKTLNKQKKLASTQLSNCDFYSKISANYDRLELDQVLSCLLELDLRISTSTNQISTLTNKIKEAYRLHDEHSKKLKSLLDNKGMVKDLSDGLERDQSRLQQELSFMVESRIKLEAKKKEVNTIAKSLESSIATLELRKKEIMNDKNKLTKEITEAEGEIERLKKADKIPKGLEKHFETLMANTPTYQLEGKDELQQANDEKRLTGIHDRISMDFNHLTKDVKDLQLAQNILSKKIDLKNKSLLEEKKTLKGYEREYAAVQEKLANIADTQRRTEELKGELSDVTILIEKLSRKLGEQKGQDELISKLYTNVEGFRGELGTLIKPVHDRYALALSVALGKAKNYLVVKSEKAANLTNEILKEKFIHKTVVILDNIPQVKNSEITAFRNECGTLGSAAYDIAEFDKSNKDIEPCLRYFLRGKAVCETLDRAYKLRAQQEKKANIITVAGEQLRGSYISSYGNTEAINEQNATKNAIKEKIEVLKTRKGELEEQIKSMAGYEDVQNADLLRERIANLNSAIKQMEMELESFAQEQQRLSKELASKENSKKLKEVDLNDVLRQLEKVKEDVKQSKELRKGKLKEIILDYASQNKIKEKNELLELVLTRIEATVDKEISLRQFMTNKRRQIAELGLEDIDDRISTTQGNLDSMLSTLKELDTEISKQQKKCDETRKELESLIKKKDESKVEYMRQIEAETKFRTHLRETSDELDNLRSALRNAETDFQSGLRRKTQLIEEKTLEGITIPTKKEDIPEAIKTTLKKLGEQATATVDYTSLVERLRSGEGGIISEEIEREDDDNIDASHVDVYKMFSLDSVASVKRFLTKEFEKSGKELNSMSTKFVTDDTIDREKKKLSKIVDDISTVKKELERVRDGKQFREGELTKYKALRNERFISLFNAVSARIRDVYKRLNRNDNADATLALEFPTDPCSGGIMYNPTPPNKKYIFDTASLSGGEKALASLALYFAINDALRSPVLMLDEADSALDKQNVALVQAYLRSLSKSKQIVTVSHNSWFIRRASTLLGITKIPSENTSGCFHFDLDYYRNREEEKAY